MNVSINPEGPKTAEWTERPSSPNNPKLQLTFPSIHPSIFYTRLIRRSGRRGAGAYPSGHRARGGVHPGQVASPSQGHIETNETNNLTRSHSLLMTILETPVNLTCMFLDIGFGKKNFKTYLTIHYLFIS